MRLSDAIRLGAMLHPQCFRNLNVRDPRTQRVVLTCALGAANEAGYNTAPLADGFGGPVRCPECPEMRVFGGVIVHLNDDHEWTRERIADWVETVEPGVPEDAAIHETDKRVASLAEGR